MDKQWSELNKTMQAQIKKKSEFENGIDTLFELRGDMTEEIMGFKNRLCLEEYSAIPYINGKGYDNKTVAYSLWHIFRIEDIVANTLIRGEEQVFFSGSYQSRTASPIITTGNELVKEEIAEFSSKLDIDGLYSYIEEVKKSTELLLRDLTYDDLKRKMTDSDKGRLLKLNVVSTDENAFWLVDYWCGKSIEGLIKMPFSRHWIMHVEACRRIINRINKLPKGKTKRTEGL